MTVHMVFACPLIHNMILPTQVQTFYKEHEFLFIFTIQNLVQSTLVVTKNRYNSIIIKMTHSSRLPCCCKDVKEILLKQLGGEAPKI